MLSVRMMVISVHPKKNIFKTTNTPSGSFSLVMQLRIHTHTHGAATTVQVSMDESVFTAGNFTGLHLFR